MDAFSATMRSRKVRSFGGGEEFPSSEEFFLSHQFLPGLSTHPHRRFPVMKTAIVCPKLPPPPHLLPPLLFLDPVEGKEYSEHTPLGGSVGGGKPGAAATATPRKGGKSMSFSSSSSSSSFSSSSSSSSFSPSLGQVKMRPKKPQQQLSGQPRETQQQQQLHPQDVMDFPPLPCRASEEENGVFCPCSASSSAAAGEGSPCSCGCHAVGVWRESLLLGDVHLPFPPSPTGVSRGIQSSVRGMEITVFGQSLQWKLLRRLRRGTDRNSDPSVLGVLGAPSV